MRSIARVIGAIVFVMPSAVLWASGLTAPDVTVGRNLQACPSIKLPAPAPPEGLKLTVTSDDPAKMLLATAPDKPGSASIVITAGGGLTESQGFCIQGRADQGAVTYSVTAPGTAGTKGKVTLAPSGVVILGPAQNPSYQTFPRADPVKITLVTAALDSSMQILEEQPVSGGSPLTVRIANSHPASGDLLRSTLTLAVGESEAVTGFKPMAEGQSTLSLVQPEGFRTPSTLNRVEIVVEKPGVALSDNLTIGRDLQGGGLLCLGAPAGPDGVEVKITSSDPSKLLLSTALDKPGSASITLTVPPNAFTAKYFLQALADSGIVEQEATAPGYRARIAHTELAPSGLIVGYEHYGPPDEAAVFRKTGEHEDRAFYTTLAASKQEPVRVIVWAAYLSSGLAADFTVQALRPGVSVTAKLDSTDPAVGTIESPVTIPSGSDHAISRFTPLTQGKTVIKLQTPSNFTTPKNATYVPAFVNP